MYFHGGIEDQLPFEGWNPENMQQYLGSLAILFVVTVFYEFLQTLRAVLERYWWWTSRVSPEMEASGSVGCCGGESDTIVPEVEENKSKTKSVCPCGPAEDPKTPTRGNSSTSIIMPKAVPPTEDATIFYKLLWYTLPARVRPFLAGGRATEKPMPSPDYPAFRASHDIPRAMFHAVEVTIGYVLMLVAMTYNTGHFFSLVAGFTVGSLLFGRFRSYKPSCCA